VINIINIAVSPCLVYGLGPLPKLGVTGIVTGTVLARTLGAILILAFFVKGRAGLKLDVNRLRPSGESTLRLMRVGLPAACDGVVMWGGHFLFLMIVSHLALAEFGQAMLAAHIISVRVEALTYLPATAWATATATMVGQAIGAKNEARARKIGHEAVLQCGLLSVASAAIFYFGAGVIYRIMHTDPLVHAVGIPPFRVIALFQPCLAISIVYVGALRGAGDTRTPLLITLMGVLLVRLPLGYTFGIVLQGGLMGAWIGMCADMTWRALGAWLRYRSGRWTQTSV